MRYAPRVPASRAAEAAGRFGGVVEWISIALALLGLASMESCVDWIWS